MADKGTPASIADSSKPNAGRIYDFLLGGNHNFEVDRMASQNVLKVAPFAPQMSRLIRWFLGAAVQRIADEGYRNFIDFASGLPTVDHIHQCVPQGSKIIYSDLDPVTVAYGKEIIKDIPNVEYLLCDASKPEDLLESPAVRKMFGTDRKMCFGLNGICWFLSDEAIEHSMKTLYEWAAPGARLFLCDGDVTGMIGEQRAVFDLYKNMGQPVFYRTIKKIQEIIRPWKVLPPGFHGLDTWVDVKKTASEDMRKLYGTGIVGGILGKD